MRGKPLVYPLLSDEQIRVVDVLDAHLVDVEHIVNTLVCTNLMSGQGHNPLMYGIYNPFFCGERMHLPFRLVG